jgi:flagellar hook-basal body complex protein FliE
MPGGPSGAVHATFADLVSEGIQRVSDGLIDSQSQIHSLVSGDAENLHQVMLKLEESKLSFHLFLQVRNRLLESYQEVMRMQV